MAQRRTAMAAVCLALALLSGCRNDMHNQPRMKPLRQSDFFTDHREGRPLVAGTVARGQLIEDRYFLTGMEQVNEPGNRLPFPLTADVLRRGQERFDIYCSPCHSRIGDGNGMIVQRGYRHPPSFHGDTLLIAPLGHFFDVMSNGFGAMPDYAQQLSLADRWAVAAYIRALQFSQNASINDVPPEMRGSIAHARNSIVVAPGVERSMGELPAAREQVIRNLGNESTGPGGTPQMVQPQAQPQQPQQQQPAQPNAPTKGGAPKQK
jgi:cytochrome c553